VAAAAVVTTITVAVLVAETSAVKQQKEIALMAAAELNQLVVLADFLLIT
jgi:hypothetical protein